MRSSVFDHLRVLPRIAVLAAIAAAVAAGAAPAWAAPAGSAQMTTTEGSRGISFGLVPPDWTAVFTGDGAAPDGANAVVSPADGVVYVAGQRVSAAGGFDLVVLKYVGGTLKWTAVYDGAGHGEDVAQALAVSRSGAVFAAGHTTDSAGHQRLLVVRLRPDGTRVWARTYAGPDGGADLATRVVVDRDGNVTAGGTSLRSGKSDWVVVSWTAGGTRRWAQRYDGSAHGDDHLNDLWADASGSVFACGVAGSTTGQNDGVLARYSEAGKRLWVRRFDDPAHGNDEFRAIAAAPGGGVYVCGVTYDVSTGTDGLLARYTVAGARKSSVVVQGFGGGTTTTFLLDVAVTSGGKVVFAGWDQSAANGIDQFWGVYDPVTAGFKFKAMATSAGVQTEALSLVAADALGGYYFAGFMGDGGGTAYVRASRGSEVAGGGSWLSEWMKGSGGFCAPFGIAVRGATVYVAGSYYSGPGSGYDGFVIRYRY